MKIVMIALVCFLMPLSTNREEKCIKALILERSKSPAFYSGDTASYVEVNILANRKRELLYFPYLEGSPLPQVGKTYTICYVDEDYIIGWISDKSNILYNVKLATRYKAEKGEWIKF